MEIRPNIELVIGAIVENRTQYRIKDVKSPFESDLTLGDLENKSLELFGKHETNILVNDRLYLGNPAFDRDTSHIIGYVFERISTQMAWLTIDLLDSILVWQSTNGENYIEVLQISDYDYEKYKKYYKGSGDWELARKEHRTLYREPYPNITLKWWEAARRVLLTAGYAVPRENLRMYLVASWC